jgi:hypothetical protein
MEITNLQKEKQKLEEKIKDDYEKPRKQEIPAYLRTRGGEYKGVLEREMLLSQLPHGKDWRVMGLYNPQDHSMIVGSDLHKGQKEHTRNHEIVHSYGFHDENTTDRIASRYDYQIYSRAA